MATDNKELTKWTFLREIKMLPAKCRKLSSITSRKKAEELFYKYSSLISYGESYQEDEKKQISDLRKICDALKSGTVKYKNGFFKISEILKIETNEHNITVFFKHGTEIKFDKSFDWLYRLF